MTEGEQLLRAVLCDPDDDTARLVYADWLQENGGDARAEFIRSQVADGLAHKLWLRPSVYNLNLSELGFIRDIPDGWEIIRITRGFVDEIELPAASFTEEVARSLFSRHPVERVVLTDREPDWEGSQCGWIRIPDDDEAEAENLRARRDAIPSCIYELLSGGTAEADSLTWRRYAARELARAALSDACCLWGRSLATPPLMPTLVSATGPRRPTVNHRSPPTRATGKSETPTSRGDS